MTKTDTIIGDDYNCVLDPKTDVQIPREIKIVYANTPSVLQNAMKLNNFTEIWRETNPRKFNYTYILPF